MNTPGRFSVEANAPGLLTRLRPYQFLLLLAALAALAVFLELGRMDVVTANEGQRAAPPAEMLRRDDLIIPTLNDRPYLTKPPLLYWAIAGVYVATGVISELTARIPTAVCGLFMALCVYLGLRRRTGEGPARWTALATFSSPYFLERARWAEIDVPLTLATFLAVIAVERALSAEQWPRRLATALGAGLALGAATMLKGPPPYLVFLSACLAYVLLECPNPAHVLWSGAKYTAIAFLTGLALWLAAFSGLQLPFPVALSLLVTAWFSLAVYHAGRAMLRSLPLLIVVLAVALTCAVPWALAVLHRIGWAQLQELLNYEVVQRTHTATAINSGSPFFYVIALPLMLAPWGLLLPLHLSAPHWAGNNRFYRFSLLTGWLSVAIFSLIAGKEYEYILPAVPFLIVPLGYHLEELSYGAGHGWTGVWGTWWLRIIKVLIPFGAIGVVIWTVAAEFHWPLLIETSALALLIMVIMFFRGRPDLSRMAICVPLLVTSVLLTRSFHYTGERSPKELATLCSRLLEAGYTVEGTITPENPISVVTPAIIYYLGHPIGADAKPGSIRAKLEGQVPYFYLTREKLLDWYEADAADQLRVFGPVTNKDYVLLGNRDPVALLAGD